MKGILTVSFGVADKIAGEKSIVKIEETVRETFEGFKQYKAYTSPTVRRKLKEKYGMFIMSAEEAMDKIYSDGIDELYIISTNIINGIEYNKLCELAEKNRERFNKIALGRPILENHRDCVELIPILKKITNYNTEYEYIFMGHGTEAEADIRYRELNSAFKENGINNMRVATVEGELVIDEAIRSLDLNKKVILQPLMIVAGDHAKNDMAGNEDSFYNKVIEAGGRAECIIKGLGEFEEFRRFLIKRAEGMII